MDGEDGAFWSDGWAHDEERRSAVATNRFYAVRRAAVEEIGPQDERFVLDWEGVDWASRAAEAGWEVWFTPAATVVHVGGASLRQARLRWVIGSHRGMYLYFAQRTRPVLRPILAAVIAVRGLVKLAAAAIGLAGYERGNRS